MLYPNRFIYFEGGPSEPQAPVMSESDVQKLEDSIEDKGGLEDRKEAAEAEYKAFTDKIDDWQDNDPELKKLESSEYKDGKVKELSDLSDAHIVEMSQQFGDKAEDVAAFLKVMAGVGSNEDVSHALLARLEGIPGVDISHDPEDLNEMEQDFIQVAAEKIVEEKIAKVKSEYEAAKNGDSNAIALEAMLELELTRDPKEDLDKATKAYDDAVQKLEAAKKALDQYKEDYEGFDEALTEQALNNVKARIQGKVTEQKGKISDQEQKVIESIDGYLQANVDYGTAYRAKGAAEKNYRTFQSAIDDKMDVAVDAIKDSEDQWVKSLGKLDNAAIIAIAGQFGDKAADVKKFLQVMVKSGSNEPVSNALLSRLEGIDGVDVDYDPEDLNDMKEDFINVAAERIVKMQIEVKQREYVDAKTNPDSPTAKEVMKDMGLKEHPLKTVYAANEALEAQKGKVAKAEALKNAEQVQLQDDKLELAKLERSLYFTDDDDKPVQDEKIALKQVAEDEMAEIGDDEPFVPEVDAEAADETPAADQADVDGQAQSEPDAHDSKPAVEHTVENDPDGKMELTDLSDREIVDTVAAELGGEDFNLKDFFANINGFKNVLVAKGLEKVAKAWDQDVVEFAASKAVDYNLLLQNPDGKFDSRLHLETKTGLGYVVEGVGPGRQELFKTLGIEFSSKEIKKEGQKFDLKLMDGSPLAVTGINMEDATQIEVSSSTHLEDAKKNPADFRWTLKVSYRDSDVVETLTFQGDKVVDYAGLGITDDQGRLCGLSGKKEQVDEKQDAALKAILDGKKFSQLKAFPNHIIAGYFERANEDHPEKVAKKYGIDYAQLDSGKDLFDVAKHKDLQQLLAQE